MHCQYQHYKPINDMKIVLLFDHSLKSDTSRIRNAKELFLKRVK